MRMASPAGARLSVRQRTAGVIAIAVITALWAATTHAARAEPADMAETDPAALVTPIDWAAFSQGRPAGDGAQLMERILLNTVKYALGTWYPETYGQQQGDHLDFGGIGEHQIRPPASEALALATALKTDVYDPAAVGVEHAEAEWTTLHLIDSLAYRHVSTSPDTGWGDHWQSALWAYWAGSAGWFMWDELSPPTRDRVARMVEHEADRFIGYEVPYYRDVAGDILSPGDTKAEENAWNALILQLATAMMPGHPHWRQWMDKGLELMVSAYARPQDVTSQDVVNGKTLSQWLDGSNTGEDATVVNHNILHPEYQTPVSFNVAAGQSYTLAGMETPRAAFFNAAEVYRSLVDLEFPSPPYAAPGGTVYQPGSSDIYYPQGSDWGAGRRMIYAWLDVQAATYGLDHLASTGAEEWAALHAGKVLEMQGRFDDGRVFGDWDEFRYAGREQFVAVQAAQAYLVYWIDHQGGMRVTNRPFPLPPNQTDIGDLTLDLPGRLTPGQPVEVTAVFENDGRIPLGRVDVRLDLPAEWTAEPAALTHGLVSAGETVTSTFQVTAPLVARPDAIAATASFRLAGETREVRARAKSAPLWASAEGAMLLVGEPDESSREFALSPDGNTRFLERFPAGVDLDVETGDPAEEWSYIQPGPRDRWAGSRSHPFTARFTLDEAPDDDLVFTTWLVDTHYTLPPVIAVDLNGQQLTTVPITRGGGDGFHWGDGKPNQYGGVVPTSFGVRLPADVLQQGENRLTLSSLSGSWVVYDAFGLHPTT